MSNNVDVWELEFNETHGPIIQCEKRFKSAYNVFIQLVMKIRFMPSMQKIRSDIMSEIAKVEKEGKLELEAIHD